MLKESDLRSHLRKVSRSFYITLVILPREIFKPISIAYLLARIADTVADTLLQVSFKNKRDFLIGFKKQIQNENLDENFLKDLNKFLFELKKYPIQRDLIRFIPDLFSFYVSLNETERFHVKSITVRLITGIENDLDKFESINSSGVIAIDSFDEFDSYTYNAAGCVGEFWTEISLKNNPSISFLNYQKMMLLGIQFGKALQITNIIRDIRSDFDIGRCYIPNQLLNIYHLKPQDLIQEKLSMSAKKLIRNVMLINLESYLHAIEYFLLIPRMNFRLRLACLIPILIGIKTIKQISLNQDSLTNMSVKISRTSVYMIVINSFWIVISTRLPKSYLYSIIDEVRLILNR